MPPKKKPANGNPPPPDDIDDEEGGDGEESLTRADVTKMINGAVRSQLGRLLPTAIQEGLKPVLEQLSTLNPANGGEGGEGGDDDEEQPTGKRKADPALSKLTKQVENLTKQVKEKDDKLSAEAAARKAAQLDTELGRALDSIGVDKLRLRGALAIHRGAAFIDDAGAVKFRAKRDGYEEELDPAEALKEWADTDEGKSYLAPTGSTGGSGARASRGNSSGAARKQAAAGDDKAAAAQALPGLIDEMIGGGGGFTI
jgi:hypothetical protein